MIIHDVKIGVIIAGLILSGCGSPETGTPVEPPAGQMGLIEVGEMYTMYIKQFKKPPAKKGDFEKYSAGFTIGSLGVQNGDIVVLWNATPPADTDQAAKNVLAFEKKTPSEGGFVLLQGGSVKTMTAAEFNAAPKANTP